MVGGLRKVPPTVSKGSWPNGGPPLACGVALRAFQWLLASKGAPAGPRHGRPECAATNAHGKP